MKKYLIILSAAFIAATGCMQFEHDVPVDEVYVDAPSITINSVGDEGFTATINPVSGTGYYSYAVLKGSPKEVDATAVFKLGLSGSIMKATTSYAKSQSCTFTAEGLDMNSEYTVYAVSSSELGCIGSVTSVAVHTSDSVLPSITDAETTGTKLVLSFSEAVSYNENIPIAVYYYAINKGLADNKPIGKVEDVKVSGNGSIINVDCGSMPDGAYFAVNIPANSFKDAAGNSLPAVESGFSIEEGEVADFGITGRKATKAFELSIYGGKPVTVVTSMSDAIWMSIPEGVQIAKFDNSKEGLIEYEFSDGIHSSTDSYVVKGGAPDYGYGWNGNYNCALTYPNAGEYFTGRPDPARGSMVTITIPSFLTDIYGNENAEFVIGPFLYSYGYSLNDVIGTYVYNGEGYFEGPDTNILEIKESDDKTKGNVMFTTIFGDVCDYNVYADFDVDLGTLKIADFQPIWDAPQYQGAWYFAVDGADFVTLQMPKAGVLKDTGTWFGYYVDGELAAGWGEIYSSFMAERVTITPSSAPKIRKISGKEIIR